MNPQRTFKVGLIGAGYVSQFHVAALQRLPNVSIVGVCDLDTMLAGNVAGRCRAQAFTSVDQLLSAGVDVVHVLTPPHTHADVALQALAAGCHVLVEKPLATSVEDCDRIAEAAQRAGKVLCVNHSLLGDPLIKRTIELVRRGAVGEVVSVELLRSSNYPPYRGGPLPPQYREGGYPFRDLGVHALYLLQELLGAITNVNAEFRTSGATGSDPNLHFDEWRALVNCERGSGHIQLSWNVRPMQHLLIVQGTKGTLRVDLFSMFLTRRRNTPLPKAIERVANAMSESASAAMQVFVNAAKFTVGRLVPYQGLHNLVHDFYQALGTGGPAPVNLEAARDVVHWTEHAAREADAEKTKYFSRYQPSGQPAIVVTGANGHLGRALVKRLLSEGERVRLFVRRAPSLEIREHPQVEVVLGELGDPRAVDAALAGATKVFHLGAAMGGGWAAYESATIVGTQNVTASCAKHGVLKLVYASSLSVLDWAGHPLNQPVTEASALEPRPKDRGFYTQAKLEAERIVLSAVEKNKLPCVILRPGQIWSEQAQLLTPAVGIKAGKRLIMIGNRSLKLPLVHVDDVVEALWLAARSGFSSGEIFQVVDDNLVSREELAKLLGRSREPGLKILPLPLPVACLAALGFEVLFKLLGRSAPISSYRLHSAVAPLVFDCTKARTQLQWRPAIGSGTALRTLLSPKSVST